MTKTNNTTKMKKLLLFLTLLTAVTTGSADVTDNLIFKMDFSDTKAMSVNDAVAGITARVISPAKVEGMGQYHVLNLGSSTGYLDLTAAAGELLAAMNSFTVSVYYRVKENTPLTGNGHFLWAFTTSTACTATAGAYTAYRLNAQRYASSPGGYNNEKGFALDTPRKRGAGFM